MLQRQSLKCWVNLSRSNMRQRSQMVPDIPIRFDDMSSCLSKTSSDHWKAHVCLGAPGTQECLIATIPFRRLCREARSSQNFAKHAESYMCKGQFLPSLCALNFWILLSNVVCSLILQQLFCLLPLRNPEPAHHCMRMHSKHTQSVMPHFLPRLQGLCSHHHLLWCSPQVLCGPNICTGAHLLLRVLYQREHAEAGGEGGCHLVVKIPKAHTNFVISIHFAPVNLTWAASAWFRACAGVVWPQHINHPPCYFLFWCWTCHVWM